MLHHATWRPLAALEHAAALQELEHEGLTVYHERDDIMYRPEDKPGRKADSGFLLESLPLVLPESRSAPDSAARLPGIGEGPLSHAAAGFACIILSGTHQSTRQNGMRA